MFRVSEFMKSRIRCLGPRHVRFYINGNFPGRNFRLTSRCVRQNQRVSHSLGQLAKFSSFNRREPKPRVEIKPLSHTFKKIIPVKNPEPSVGCLIEYNQGQLGTIVRKIPSISGRHWFLLDMLDGGQESVNDDQISYVFPRHVNRNKIISDVSDLTKKCKRVNEILMKIVHSSKPGKSLQRANISKKLFGQSPNSVVADYATHKMLCNHGRFIFMGGDAGYFRCISDKENEQRKWNDAWKEKRRVELRAKITESLGLFNENTPVSARTLTKLNSFCSLHETTREDVVLQLADLALTSGMFDNKMVAKCGTLAKKFIHFLLPAKTRGSVEGPDAWEVLRDLKIWGRLENVELLRSHEMSELIEVPDWAKEFGTRRNKGDTLFDDRDSKIRKDFSDLVAFTLDDVSTTDVDDAVAIDPKPTKDGGFRVFVHVADVDRSIPAHSHMDLFARSRATSIYFPEEVIHLLPDQFVNKIGIFPKKKNDVLTFRIDVSPRGKITSYDVHIGRLSNVSKVSYKEADSLLNSKNASSKSLGRNSHTALLKRMVELSALLELERERCASVEFILPIPIVKIKPGKFRSNINTPTKDLIQSVSSDEVYQKSVARSIIKEFMVLAGQAAALYSIKHKIPVPFRQLEDFECEWPIDHNGNPVADPTLNPIVLSTAMFKTINAAFARSTKGAHAALGVKQYAQATSPIRRYCDAILHHQLKAHIRGEPLPWDAPCLDFACVNFLATDFEHDMIMQRRSRFWVCEYLRDKLENSTSDDPVILNGLSVSASEQRRNKGLRTQILLRDFGIRVYIQSNEFIPIGSEIKLKLLHVDYRLGSLTFDSFDASTLNSKTKPVSHSDIALDNRSRLLEHLDSIRPPSIPVENLGEPRIPLDSALRTYADKYIFNGKLAKESKKVQKRLAKKSQQNRTREKR
eukprot:49196_1